MRNLAEHWIDSHSAMFTAHCGCCHRQDQHVLSFDNVADAGEEPLIELSIYYTGRWHDPHEDPRWGWGRRLAFLPHTLWHRVRVAAGILFLGRTENEHYAFVFNDRESIESYVEALRKALGRFGGDEVAGGEG